MSVTPLLLYVYVLASISRRQSTRRMNAPGASAIGEFESLSDIRALQLVARLAPRGVILSGR